MGLYIKGAKKPTECRNCIFIEPSLKIGKKWRHRCFLTLKFIEDSECPLIEIPTPHGRLIDENDVKAKCVNEVFDNMGTVAITETYFGDEWADDICDVPTIIEAEE